MARRPKKKSRKRNKKISKKSKKKYSKKSKKKNIPKENKENQDNSRFSPSQDVVIGPLGGIKALFLREWGGGWGE